MRNHLILFILVLLCGNCCFLQGRNYVNNEIDSLTELTYIEQNTPKSIVLINEIFKKAKAPEHDKYIVKAAYYAAIYYHNRNKQDSVKHYVDILTPIAEREMNWAIYFDAQRLLINIHVIKEDYELALNEASLVLKKAKSLNNITGIINSNLNLATAYLATNRQEKGKKALEEARKAVISSQNSDVIHEINVLSLLIPVAKMDENQDSLFVYLQELENELENHIQRKPALKDTYNSIYTFIYTYYSYYYIQTLQPQKAADYLERAAQSIDTNTFYAYKAIYHDALSDYYVLIDNKEKALQELDTSLLLFKNILGKDYYNQLNKKADLLVKYERYNEALPLYQLTSYALDSIACALSNKQMSQLQEIYNLNRLTLENEKVRNNKQKTILIFSIVVLLLIMLFAIRTIFVGKKLKISELQMRKAAETAKEANEIKNRFLSNMSYNIRTPLNSVVGFSQLIAADPNMDESLRKEYSTIIQEKSEELMRLVNDVLDLSRLESGMMKFNIQEYDISVLCQEAIYAARQKEDKKISVTFEPHEQELPIITDTNRFSQVMVNMLTYSTPYKGTDVRKMRLSLDTDQKNVYLYLTGSPLVAPELSGQENNIKNEINRLFFKHFQGCYLIDRTNKNNPIIIFSYPLALK